MAYDRRGRRRGGASATATANADTLRFPLAGSAATRGAASIGADAVSFPLTVFAVHWLVVQVAASLAFRLGAPTASSAPYNTTLGDPVPLTGLAHVFVEPLRQWDGLWYKLVAENGYGRIGEYETAFWPLYPWLMNLGSRLTGWTADTAGYLISHLAFGVALILLYRLVALDFDLAVARRTLVAIAFFPTALFFSAVYSESLFLMLAVGALLAARLGHWWLAGVAGALAALTRSYGILLLIPFAVLFLQQYRLELRRWFPNAIAAALPLLGPALFAWHLERTVGNWRASFDAQTGWDRYASTPLATLRCGFVGCTTINGDSDGAAWGWLATLLDRPTWATLTDPAWRLDVANSDTLELVCTILFFALALVGLRAPPPYQSAYLIPGLIIPLFQPSIVHALMSMPRFGLTLFPFFVVLALLIRTRAVAIPVLTVSTLLLVLLTVQFANWYWVS